MTLGGAEVGIVGDQLVEACLATGEIAQGETRPGQAEEDVRGIAVDTPQSRLIVLGRFFGLPHAQQLVGQVDAGIARVADFQLIAQGAQMALRVDAVVQAVERATPAATAEQLRQHDAEKVDQAAKARQGDDQVQPVAILATANHMQAAGDLAGDDEEGEQGHGAVQSFGVRRAPMRARIGLLVR